MVASVFWQGVKQSSADDLVKLQEQIKKLKEDQKAAEEKIKELDEVIGELEKKRDKVWQSTCDHVLASCY